MTWLARFLKDRRGATAVEFAIIGNLFIALILGVFTVGYIFVVRSDLESSISAAERYALVHDEDNTALTSVIRDKLVTYDGNHITVSFQRASKSGVDYVRTELSYSIDLGVSWIMKPLTISATRVFPT